MVIYERERERERRRGREREREREREKKRQQEREKDRERKSKLSVFDCLAQIMEFKCWFIKIPLNCFGSKNQETKTENQ